MTEPGVSKQKNPYQGVGVVSFFLIGLPTGLFFLFRAVLLEYSTKSEKWANAQALVFAGAIGVIFCFMLMLLNGFTRSRQIVAKRWKEFFGALRWENASHAWQWYFQDLKYHGAAFWIYMLLFAYNIAMLAKGLHDFLALISA